MSKDKSILVVGDLILDKYIVGKVTRISPEAPVPIVNVFKEEHKLGGAANVAHNLVRLEEKVTLCGLLGNDDDAKKFVELLASTDIQNNCIISDDFRTINKTRIIGENQQIVRLDYEEKYKDKVELENLDTNNHTYAIISDYGKGFCTLSLCKFLLESRLKVIVDPKGTHWEKYRNAYLITPNFKEFKEFLGKEIENNTKIIEKEAQHVIKLLGLKYLLITRSEKGMTLVDKDGSFHVDTVAKEVFDVTGAGDTSIATLTAYLNQGYEIKSAVIAANRAAGVAVSKVGTYAVSLSEIQ